MAEVKIKEEKILSDEHYVLKRIEFEIKKKDGQWETQKREVFDHGNAVTVLLYNKENKTVILTEQFRMPTYVNGNSSGMLVETPAGLLEDDEAPDAAIIREIKEETGYQISSVQKVFEAYSSAGAMTELIYYFVAPFTASQKVTAGGGLEEEGEEVTVMEIAFTEALQMVASSEIKDAKTILLLQYAQINGLLS